MLTRYRLTEYGFEYGPFDVERTCGTDRIVVLRVRVASGILIELAASPGGRKLWVTPRGRNVTVLPDPAPRPTRRKATKRH